MKILLATDGSTYTEAATRSVISLLRTQDSEVLVLQIVEPVVFSTPPQMASGYAPETVERLQCRIEDAKESVSRTAEMLRTAGFKADSRVVEAEIRTGILVPLRSLSERIWYGKACRLPLQGRSRDASIQVK